MLPPTSPTTVGRRSMMVGLATAVPAIALAQDAPPPAPALPAPALPAPAVPAAVPPPCSFLNAVEHRALAAITARIIPTDDLGPGAAEAQVVVFIDRQLAGAWGSGAHFYRSGPFAAGTPQQGYQLAATPADMVRDGLARTDAAFQARHGHVFADGTVAEQDAMLHDMQAGHVDFGPIPAAEFFNAVVDATMEGFFSDPLYGGNAGMVGWKLVGFPGAYDSYAQEIDRHGLEWRRDPVPMQADQDLPLTPGMSGPVCETR